MAFIRRAGISTNRSAPRWLSRGGVSGCEQIRIPEFLVSFQIATMESGIYFFDDESAETRLLAKTLAALGYGLVCSNEISSQLDPAAVGIVVLNVRNPVEETQRHIGLVRGRTTAPILVMIEPRLCADFDPECALGVDHFIFKPFQLSHLQAQLKVLGIQNIVATPNVENLGSQSADLLQTKSAALAKDGTAGGRPAFRVDEVTMDVSYNGQGLALSPKEFDLLCLLLRKNGQIVTDKEVISLLWPSKIDATEPEVRQYIYRLRRKIELDPRDPKVILTIKGKGYKLVVDGVSERPFDNESPPYLAG